MRNLPEIIDAPLHVVACPHPLKQAREEYYLAPRDSLDEILRQIQPDIDLYRAHVWVNNAYIPPDQWTGTYPPPGAEISINVVPRGAVGKIIGQVFITIAAIVVGLIVTGLTGQPWLGALTSSIILGAGNYGLSALFPTRMYQAPDTPTIAASNNLDYGKKSNTLNISGASNKENKYGPVPKYFGRHKTAPPYVARTYTESEGKNQFLRLLFCWGFGPVQLEGLKIGQTALDNYEDVEIEHRNLTLLLTSQTIAIDVTAQTLTRSTGTWITDGIKAGDTVTLTGCTTSANDTDYLISGVTALVLTYSTSTATTTEAGTGAQTAAITWGDDPVTLYPVTIQEEPLAIELLQNKENFYTSEADADELSVDITCPSGLIRFQTNGQTSKKTVNFTVRYRKTGTSGAWLETDDIEISGNTKSAVIGTVRWVLPERGEYDVRVVRLTGPDDTMTTSISYWTVLRSITNEDPIQDFPHPLAKTAMRIKATGRLNGTVDEFTGIVTGIYPDWDTATGAWITRATQNPASAYREAVQGTQNQKPMTDSRIDLAKLQYWHEYCETNGWKYNKVIDYETSIKDVLGEIASAGRAAFTWIDSKLGVIIDEPQSFVVGPVFSPRNIVKDSFQSSIAYLDLPHGWRVNFVNEEKDYQQDERIVLDDYYQLGGEDAWGDSHPEYPEATVFEQLELPGVTDPELVFKHARYHIAQARLRPETVTFKTDVEWLVATRGDRIKFAHDVMLVGLSWSRVKELVYDLAGFISGVIVDEPISTESLGTGYVMRFRLADNTSLLVPLTVTDTGYNTFGSGGTYGDGGTYGGWEYVYEVAFTTPIDPADPHPEVGDLYLFGESDLEALDLIIKSIQPESDLSATITAVGYDEALYSADVGVIPAHDSKITVPAEWWVPIVANVRSGGSVLLRQPDGSWQSRILVTLFRPSALHANITGVECEFWGTDGNEPPVILPVVPLDAGEVSIVPVEDGLSYQFRLRYVKNDLSRGGWCATVTEVVEGKTAPPANVTGFNVYQIGNVVTAKWVAIADLDLAGYEIRYGAADVPWADAIQVNGGFSGTTFTTTEVPPGTWDFLIKAVDTTGNFSAVEARKSFTVYSFYQILSALTSWPLWPGTLTNFICNPRTGNLNPDDQDIPSGNDFDVFDNYVVNPYAESSYEAPEIDLGADEAVRAWARMNANLGPGETGPNSPALSLDYKLDGGAYDGFESWVLDFLTGRYVKAKVTVDNTSGAMRLTDFQPVMDQEL